VIFPTTEQDAKPFESQRSHRCVVVVAPISLSLVVGSSPPGLRALDVTLARYTESSLESRLAAQDVMADAIFSDLKRVQ